MYTHGKWGVILIPVPDSLPLRHLTEVSEKPHPCFSLLSLPDRPGSGFPPRVPSDYVYLVDVFVLTLGPLPQGPLLLRLIFMFVDGFESQSAPPPPYKVAFSLTHSV